MKKILRIAVAQLNPHVGHIKKNIQAMIDATYQARDVLQADLIVFSELAVCGYHCEDLLMRPDFIQTIQAAIQSLIVIPNIVLVIGLPVLSTDNQLTNRAQVFLNQKMMYDYTKCHLPNYGIFDEKRYFSSGDQLGIFECYGLKIGLGICEDLWTPKTFSHLKESGISFILSLNASPFDMKKSALRQAYFAEQCQLHQMSLLYVNQIGGQDDLIFDGGSFAMNHIGQIVCQLPYFEESLQVVPFHIDQKKWDSRPIMILTESTEKTLYQALVLSLRDYIKKNEFQGVLLGLSGGIDSALVLSIAVDALGEDKVETVMMPYHYTSKMSLEDAEAMAATFNVAYSILPIESTYNALIDTLAYPFKGLSKDTTEENLQARIRGILLMALANKKRYIVLSTGNKSEMATGYTTLYGDMVGGFNVLTDVSKTLVYQLVKWRNQQKAMIPQRVIDRPPSAELAAHQIDQNILPNYTILDQILTLYVEKNKSIQDIINHGYEKNIVQNIVQRIHTYEYKRRQSPIGPKISLLAFYRERRYPITTPNTVTF
ncbi:MAG: NAD+ synthase [Endozoicomonadaceae bacterium]|nr:NAD+ synthase [Endozoicomonadaceae bacterium]